MTPQEQRLVHHYRREFLNEAGNAYQEEFKIIDGTQQSLPRWVDAIIAEGTDPIDDNDLSCLHGRNIMIIQAKVVPLNAWLVGQALLSPRLLARSARAQGWELGTVRSLALCDVPPPGSDGGNHSGLQLLIESNFTHEELEIVTLEVPEQDKPKRKGGEPSIRRIRGAAARYARETTQGGCLIKENAHVPNGPTVSGIFVLDPIGEGCHQTAEWEDVVRGQNVIVIHSEQSKRKRAPKMSAMYMADEIIAAQLLLMKELRVSSAESVVACSSIDAAVAEELTAYGMPFREWDVTKPGLTGMGRLRGHANEPRPN